MIDRPADAYAAFGRSLHLRPLKVAALPPPARMRFVCYAYLRVLAFFV